MSIRAILPLDLIFLVLSFITFILFCCFISSFSADSSCLLCRRCRLYSLNKEKTLAQQSSSQFLILYFLFLRALLHSNVSAHPCTICCFSCSQSVFPVLCLYLCALSSSICSYQFDIDDWTCVCFGSSRI